MRIAILCNDRLGIPALQQLVQSRMVVAVGTSDRSPEMIALMKQITVQAGVPHHIFSRKDLENNFSSWLTQHQPDVVLVKTFPFRIPLSVLKIPKHGFINFHYAPLPNYRGSNPLFWMIKEQVAMGGVAVHQMDENFDSGPLLFKMDVPIKPQDSFGICCTQLAYAGAHMTGSLIQSLISGTLQPVAQQKENDRWFGRPTAADLSVNWIKMNASEVMALANACNPWLKGAPARIKGWAIGITNTSLSSLSVSNNELPGTIIRISREEGLVVVCSKQTVLAIDVIYTEEGYFPGFKLLDFGIKKGDCFE